MPSGAQNTTKLCSGFNFTPGTCYTTSVVLFHVIAYPHFPFPRPCAVKPLLQQQKATAHKHRKNRPAPAVAKNCQYAETFGGVEELWKVSMSSTTPLLGTIEYKNYNRALGGMGHIQRRVFLPAV